MSKNIRDYLTELKPYLITSFVLLSAGAVLGYVTAQNDPESAIARIEELKKMVQPLLSLDKPYIALIIFFNNMLKTFIVIALGALAGIVPIVFLLTNGFVIGILLFLTMQTRGIWSFVLAIAPHGVLEIPAVLIGAGVGLLLGVRVAKRVLGRDDRSLVPEAKKALRLFVLVVIPMLLVAALVETYLTELLQ